MDTSSALVLVTGANGLVGSHICQALVERGARVRALVRRPGTAPQAAGVEEMVGDFADAEVAQRAVDSVAAVVSTVYPLGSSDLSLQQRVSIDGTRQLAEAAAAAGVDRFVHVSTAAVYEREADTGDVDEDGVLVDDDAGDYAVTKRRTDEALAQVDQITRVLVRPPAILGPGESSVWNSLRPAQLRDDEEARRADPTATFAWVHVKDLATMVADLAAGAIGSGEHPAEGPVTGGCTAVNVAGQPATLRDYVGTVTSALDVAPQWHDEPVWTGALLTGRARGWGWQPDVGLADALDELAAGIDAVGRAGH
jgi:nucleoside-diphosphate-sugar epimerase